MKSTSVNGVPTKCKSLNKSHGKVGGGADTKMNDPWSAFPWNMVANELWCILFKFIRYNLKHNFTSDEKKKNVCNICFVF